MQTPTECGAVHKSGLLGIWKQMRVGVPRYPVYVYPVADMQTA
jgi:hypothetical protein